MCGAPDDPRSKKYQHMWSWQWTITILCFVTSLWYNFSEVYHRMVEILPNKCGDQWMCLQNRDPEMSKDWRKADQVDFVDEWPKTPFFQQFVLDAEIVPALWVQHDKETKSTPEEGQQIWYFVFDQPGSFQKSCFILYLIEGCCQQKHCKCSHLSFCWE